MGKSERTFRMVNANIVELFPGSFATGFHAVNNTPGLRGPRSKNELSAIFMTGITCTDTGWLVSWLSSCWRYFVARHDNDEYLPTPSLFRLRDRGSDVTPLPPA